ncbi:hypothetical protein [Priestia endophytica]|uniref:hypothetical protein n=1 Tax=Priestia endophytica TaxID=135735 RepID=UPI000FBB915A|nr:hypothetical protein [Priestia endophytica]MED4071027.1 hypothetical protein [Priestia endophytica]RPK14720.1 hypothetical protein FH5_00155 [Priestia endophytica]
MTRPAVSDRLPKKLKSSCSTIPSQEDPYEVIGAITIRFEITAPLLNLIGSLSEFIN